VSAKKFADALRINLLKNHRFYLIFADVKLPISPSKMAILHLGIYLSQKFYSQIFLDFTVWKVSQQERIQKAHLLKIYEFDDNILSMMVYGNIITIYMVLLFFPPVVPL
jgi:hypothetical protein